MAVFLRLSRVPLGKHLTKAITVWGTKAETRRKLRKMLTVLDQDRNPVPQDVSLRE